MTPQAERLLRYFKFDHLPEPLQEVSSLFHALAITVAQQNATDGAEQTVALRKLLEAKDAAVRCMLPGLNPPEWAPPAIYREGWDAAIAGQLSDTNPYPDGGTEHGAWIVGFSHALEERRKGYHALS